MTGFGEKDALRGGLEEDRRRCAAGGVKGGEVGGAGGVVGGADAQVKVDGEEEGELEGVELGEGEAADLRPVKRTAVILCLGGRGDRTGSIENTKCMMNLSKFQDYTIEHYRWRCHRDIWSLSSRRREEAAAMFGKTRQW